MSEKKIFGVDLRGPIFSVFFPCIKLLFYCQGSIMYVESCVYTEKTSINIRTTKYTK